MTRIRNPSICFGFRIPLNNSKKLSIVTSFPFETSPRSGRVVRNIGGGNSGRTVVGEIEIQIESRQVPPFLLLDFVDMELRENHPAFRVIRVRKRHKAGGKCALCKNIFRGHLGEFFPRHTVAEFDSNATLHSFSLWSW